MLRKAVFALDRGGPKLDSPSDFNVELQYEI